MKLLAAAIIALAPAIALAQEPLAFKGLALGSSEEEVLKQYPKSRCSGSPQRRHCMTFLTDLLRRNQPMPGSGVLEDEARQTMTVAGVPVEYFSFTLYDGKLGSISMAPASSAFDRIAAAFVDRYGKPSLDQESQITTRAGVAYRQREIFWSIDGGRIRLERYGSDITKSWISYTSSEALEAMKADREESRKKAAKDL